LILEEIKSDGDCLYVATLKRDAEAGEKVLAYRVAAASGKAFFIVLITPYHHP